MGGCASKPKDSDTRKMPGRAVRLPHAPPERPISPRDAADTGALLEKKDGDEDKTKNLVDVTEPAPPKINEGAAAEVKPIAEEAVPATAKEEKKEVTGIVAPEVEEKEIVAPMEEKKDESIETLVPKEELVEEETVVPEVTEVVVVQGGKREVVEAIVAELKKDDVAEIVVPEEVFLEVAETVAPKADKKEEATKIVAPKELVQEKVAEIVAPEEKKDSPR